MRLEGPWLEGRLLRRYKRFLADVELSDGRRITAHTPNTGSLKGCAEPGMRVWLRDTGDPKRKYRHSWELVEVRPGVLVGIHTGLSNRLVREAIAAGRVASLQGYDSIRSEVRYGRERSRIDLLLEAEGRPPCYVEVKNVTLVEDGIAAFPDAVSTRGQKHLRELAEMARQGRRAVIFFCIQRRDAREMRPADAIDPVYGRTLREALAAGIEAVAMTAVVSPERIELQAEVPVVCPPL
ncbi:sugar fermentation stimulation protein A [Methylomarinovum caldicuralii]|uniref:Sugar fermentation stimulation protein homolog n=1 Tax=Methylomarinovum caldicuralii TaxID=438856 RepID=A0AAU9CE10_9GAMM|nr:DNA/RNA nuclease SfsA [Methylomarinovum caldicuralii]BCX82879.1 sugar fermentation stimulation protein A [Methylomarinovum caldicuralii]